VPAVRVLFFAHAREVAGRRDDTIDAPTLSELLAVIRERYGPAFGEVLDVSRIWVNGDEPEDGRSTPLAAGDEVAVLPPVSGGAVATR
jgi:molybdopterin synthase sulfur carrier subunit